MTHCCLSVSIFKPKTKIIMKKRLLYSLKALGWFLLAVGFMIVIGTYPSTVATIVIGAYCLFWFIMWIRWLVTGKF